MRGAGCCLLNPLRRPLLSSCPGGELFAWGENLHGQLGVGRGIASTPTPQMVEHLYGVPLAQVSAGGAHSVALSMSGNVYSWGGNDFGQLGLGHTDGTDARFPPRVVATCVCDLNPGLPVKNGSQPRFDSHCSRASGHTWAKGPAPCGGQAVTETGVRAEWEKKGTQPSPGDLGTPGL